MKYIAPALLALTSATCLIIAHAGDNGQFNGVYLGGAIGGMVTSANMDSASEFTVDGGDFFNSAAYRTAGSDSFYGTVTENSSDSLSTQSTVWTARLGYGSGIYDWPLWLGLEIFGDFGDREIEQNGFGEYGPIAVSHWSEMSLNQNEFGIDFRPGILVTPSSLLYARVGFAYNILHLDSTVEGYYYGEPSALNMDESEKVFGLRLGAGFEQKMSCNLSFSLDYIYTDYGNISNSGSYDNLYLRQVCFQPDCGEYIAGSSDVDRVKTQAVMLGVNYYPMAKGCE